MTERLNPTADDRQHVRFLQARKRVTAARQAHAEATVELGSAVIELEAATAAFVERTRIAERMATRQLGRASR